MTSSKISSPVLVKITLAAIKYLVVLHKRSLSCAHAAVQCNRFLLVHSLLPCGNAETHTPSLLWLWHSLCSQRLLSAARGQFPNRHGLEMTHIIFFHIPFMKTRQMAHLDARETGRCCLAK